MAHRTTWIKLHGDVFANKKIVLTAARLARGDVYRIVGHLGRLWVWAMDNAEDGNLGHLVATAIADAAGWKGNAQTFVGVLADVGLLDYESEVDKKTGEVRRLNFCIHDWNDYAGRLIERRRDDRDRKKAARESEKRNGVSAGHPQEVPQSVRYPREEAEEEKTASQPEGGTKSSSGLERDPLDHNGAMSRVTDALNRLAGYTSDPDLAAELARDDGILAIVEQISPFADELAKPGAVALTPETQRKRIRGWLSIARAEIDAERQRVRERDQWLRPVPPVEQQIRERNIRDAREKVAALGRGELSDEERELLAEAGR